MTERISLLQGPATAAEVLVETIAAGTPTYAELLATLENPSCPESLILSVLTHDIEWESDSTAHKYEAPFPHLAITAFQGRELSAGACDVIAAHFIALMSEGLAEFTNEETDAVWAEGIFAVPFCGLERQANLSLESIATLLDTLNLYIDTGINAATEREFFEVDEYFDFNFADNVEFCIAQLLSRDNLTESVSTLAEQISDKVSQIAEEF